MGKDYNRVKQWRIDNPEKYKSQKKLEQERRKIRRQGGEVVLEDRTPWNKGVVHTKYTNLSVVEIRLRRIIEGARKRAKKFNIPFDITYDDVTIPTTCVYFNEPIDYSGTQSPYMASIDRVDPVLGYTKGNVQIVSLLANQMKSNETV